MNKSYKWKLTKFTISLIVVSISALLGLCLLGLKELTHFWGFEGYFSYTELPMILQSSIMGTFAKEGGLWRLINFVPLCIIGLLVLLCFLFMLFRLKISNLLDLLAIVLGGAFVLAVCLLSFYLLIDPAIFESIKQYALFKNVQADIKSAIPGVAIWWTALSIVGMVPALLSFCYYAIADSFHKEPKLKGDEKFYYDHFTKKELAKVASNKTGTIIGDDDSQTVRTVQTPRKKKVVINNIRVNRGTQIPQTKTNVVQFVNCDERFKENVKDKDEKVKGAKYIDAQKV